MTQNSDAGSTNQPESGAERIGKDGERDGDNNETGVELRSGGAKGTNLDITAFESANTPHTSGDEEDDKSKQPVGDEGVDAQHDEKGGIVAREVAKVVVDAVLDLAKVLWL